jgi:hypothetical protein
MLIRICLILAIVAGLAAGGLNFFMLKEKITTLKEDDRVQTEGRKKAETDLAKTRSDLTKTTAELTQTKATLETTTSERDTAQAAAAAATKKADGLTADLAKTRTERDNAQADLSAYKATSFSPEQIVAMGKQYKGLENALAGQREENKLLDQKLKKTQAELDNYIDPNRPIPLPAHLAGKVLISDPKYNFVILSVGEEQGVVKRGQMLVNRKGKLVAKVQVTSVQKDRCVANVLPGWELGDVEEGDLVIPAYPQS